MFGDDVTIVYLDQAFRGASMHAGLAGLAALAGFIGVLKSWVPGLHLFLAQLLVEAFSHLTLIATYTSLIFSPDLITALTQFACSQLSLLVKRLKENGADIPENADGTEVLANCSKELPEYVQKIAIVAAIFSAFVLAVRCYFALTVWRYIKQVRRQKSVPAIQLISDEEEEVGKSDNSASPPAYSPPVLNEKQ